MAADLRTLDARAELDKLGQLIPSPRPVPRILYHILTPRGVSGGHKMTFRHVETLRDLGFDAVCYMGQGAISPDWFEHRASMETVRSIAPDDILVLADDMVVALEKIRTTAIRTVILAQNPYFFAAKAFDVLDRYSAERFPLVMAVSEGFGATVRRAYPMARTEIVPCFADERRFRPGPDKRMQVAFAPRKRPVEAAAIRSLFQRIHGASPLEWRGLEKATEAQMAEGFAEAALCLSLNRLESVGMTTLEAMASGCVCAGFPGVGGWTYMTGDNGFWVADDDCEAAADALAEAADVVRTGGPRLAAYVEAGRATADQWSYARFRAALEAAWMRIAPETRLRNGPLD